MNGNKRTALLVRFLFLHIAGFYTKDVNFHLKNLQLERFDGFIVDLVVKQEKRTNESIINKEMRDFLEKEQMILFNYK
jgi:prophage maintenance system killer protein